MVLVHHLSFLHSTQLQSNPVLVMKLKRTLYTYNHVKKIMDNIESKKCILIGGGSQGRNRLVRFKSWFSHFSCGIFFCLISFQYHNVLQKSFKELILVENQFGGQISNLNRSKIPTKPFLFNIQYFLTWKEMRRKKITMSI